MSKARPVHLGRFKDFPKTTVQGETIAEHVRAFDVVAQLEDLGFKADQVAMIFRRRLTRVLIQYGIVLDGEDLYCAEPHGLALWHGSIDEARFDARNGIGFTTDHFFGDLNDAFRNLGAEGLYELFQSWLRGVSS